MRRRTLLSAGAHSSERSSRCVCPDVDQPRFRRFVEETRALAGSWRDVLHATRTRGCPVSGLPGGRAAPRVAFALTTFDRTARAPTTGARRERVSARSESVLSREDVRSQLERGAAERSASEAARKRPGVRRAHARRRGEPQRGGRDCQRPARASLRCSRIREHRACAKPGRGPWPARSPPWGPKRKRSGERFGEDGFPPLGIP